MIMHSENCIKLSLVTGVAFRNRKGNGKYDAHIQAEYAKILSSFLRMKISPVLEVFNIDIIIYYFVLMLMETKFFGRVKCAIFALLH